MSEIINLDDESSEDTIIFDNNKSQEDEIERILKKYSKIQQPCEFKKTPLDFSLHDLINDNGSKNEKVTEKYSKVAGPSGISNFYSLSDDDDDDLMNVPKEICQLDDVDTKLKQKAAKRVKITCDKETKIHAAEIQKLRREEKKEKLAREKAMKNALQVVEKSIKPDECMKFITVNVDYGIFEKDFGPIVRETLEKSTMSYKSKSQIIPNTITWTRSVQTLVNEELTSVQQDEKHALILMECDDFINHIEENNLTQHIQSIYTINGLQQLSLGVFGLEKYYKTLKTREKRIFQVEMRQKTTFSRDEGVSKAKIEYALSELQIMCKCYFRSLDSYEDVSMFLMECTKSVAQIPYKLKKQEKYDNETEYFAGDNKDCVQVDKNGNGLSRLWTQMLTMFPLARLETAEAITAVYPNPRSLIEDYAQCDEETGEQLLQELRVRRAAGLNSTVRKIGPEMSRKLFNFFTARDNIML